VFPFGIGIDGENTQSEGNRQENERDTFRPVSRHSIRPAKERSYGIGVGFKLPPEQFGEVRPDGPISKSPAAEFHPEGDEILAAPLI